MLFKVLNKLYVNCVFPAEEKKEAFKADGDSDGAGQISDDS